MIIRTRKLWWAVVVASFVGCGPATSMMDAGSGGGSSAGGLSGTGGGTSGGGSAGGGSAAGGSAGGSSAGGSAAGGSSSATIPSPGTTMNAEWKDVEPNDTPDKAVPVGILTTPWAGFSMPYTTINTATDVDYFVFRTGDATQLMSSQLAMCWSGNFNLLDMYLYAVDAQNHQGALVKSWTSTASGCETAWMSNGAAQGLMPNTTYLLEIRAGAGAMTPTQYSA